MAMTGTFEVVFRCQDGLWTTAAALEMNRHYRPEELIVTHDAFEGEGRSRLTVTGTRLLTEAEFRQLAARALTRSAARGGALQDFVNLLIPF